MSGNKRERRELVGRDPASAGSQCAADTATKKIPKKIAICFLAMSSNNRKRSVVGGLKILALACTVFGGTLIAGLSQLARGKDDENSIATGYNIAVHGVSVEQANCASCHLQNGAGQPEVGIPRLTGLTSSYIAEQLDYFATGARRDPVMSPYAAMLSPVQRRAVADYFASLPTPERSDMEPADTAMLNRGRELFLDGDYHTGLLSCSQCHGRTGLGVGDFSPRLAGQSADYVSQNLQQWRSGDPRDPKGNFMRAEASHLTQSDIAALAAFVASLGNHPSAQSTSFTREGVAANTPELHYSNAPASSTSTTFPAGKETGKP